MNKLQMLKKEIGGISDFVGFVFIILGLVMIPFMFSYQIFQYYYLQTIMYNSSALTLRVAEVGYSEELTNAAPDDPGDYSIAAKTEISNVFFNNIEMQGILGSETATGASAQNTKFLINTRKITPFVRIEVTSEVPVKYAGALIGKTTLPIHVILTGRKTMVKYN